MANNNMHWSSATPGFLIILLDQSSSMKDAYGEGKTKSEIASSIVNKLVDRIILCNFNKEAPKNRCIISVIAYNDNAHEICCGWLSDLYENPVRVENVQKKVSDGAGGYLEVEEKLPIWVEPKAEGKTDMLNVFELAMELVKEWTTNNPEGPTPVIINITDNIPSDIDDPDCPSDKSLLSVVENIKQLTTEDGNPLIYNICLDQTTSLLYPLKSVVNPIERNLCDISSIIPTININAAHYYGIDIPDNASCCMIGSTEDVIKFLLYAIEPRYTSPHFYIYNG